MGEQVTHSGLNVDVARPWMAVSPDGHVREGAVDAVLEIKSSPHARFLG